MDTHFVTILFTDLVGSTALFDRGGDDRADVKRREHFAALRLAVADHDGREVKSTGDGLMVAFSSAVAAVRCAVAMQRATTGAPGGLAIRVGIDAGEPLPDDTDLYGRSVIVASRLCDAADGGEILASEIVCGIARGRLREPIQAVAPLNLKGFGDRVAAARVLWREEDGVPEPDDLGAAQRQIQVVIADDQSLLRGGFRVVIDAESDMHVVGEAANGREAIDVVRRHRPDVVLMDIRMPELDGLRAAEQILSDPGLSTAVLMLTTFDWMEYIHTALQIGASGFLLKDAPADRLLDAIRVVAGGDALLDPSITRRLIGRLTSGSRAPTTSP
jgi:DNA-binding NarL/FixJ family response regulator/class 3 adenylate cyclase